MPLPIHHLQQFDRVLFHMSKEIINHDSHDWIEGAKFLRVFSVVDGNYDSLLHSFLNWLFADSERRHFISSFCRIQVLYHHNDCNTIKVNCLLFY